MRSNKSRSPRNRRLRLEQLDCRRVMASDVDLASTSGPQAVWESGPSVLRNQVTAEGSSLPDLVGFAKALGDAGVTFFGAAWSQATTEQAQMFDDGRAFLPFVEVTNANRTVNEVGRLANVQTFPTWRFADGSFATGVQSLAELSQRSGVAIPIASRATFASIGSQSVAIGSPVLLPIDVYDPENGAVVISVSVEDPTLLEATVLTGNRSARFDLNGYGDMVFQIFEKEAPRPAAQFLELASTNFYDDIIFHRVIDGFVIQGGDPLGIGTGGSPLGRFDDQFNADLQHNRKGLLSYAKSSDDTNDSQFFITADQTRTLDFNHSIFGVLVEGDDVRHAISRLGSSADKGTNASDKPLIDVTINTVDVFNDAENAVVKLKAVGNRTGATNVTITSTDTRGLTHTEVITVQVVADSGTGSNSQPFLGEVSIPENLPSDAPAVVQLSSVDVEGDPVQYTASLLSDGVSGTFDSATGLLTIRADEGFVGKALVGVGVRPANGVVGALSGQSDNQRLVFNFVSVNPPTLPAPTGVDLVEASDNGSSNSDDVTNAATVSFTVSGVQAGNQVRLFADGMEVGRGLATSSTIEISTNLIASLGDGGYGITAAQFSGSESSPFSASLNLTFDRTLPNPAKGIPSLVKVGEAIVANLLHPEEGRGLRYSFAVAPNGASIDAGTGVISWTPTDAQLGSQPFSLLLTDLAGNVRTEAFNVLVANGPIAGFRLEAANLSGDVVTNVATDEEFLLRLYSRDLREASLRSGVFSAYADVVFDVNLVTPISPAVLGIGGNFAASPSGFVLNGSIDELGAASNVTSATNVAEVLVATVRMRAVNSGLVTLATNPAEGNESETNLFGLRGSIDEGFVQYGQLDLIVGEVQDFGDASSEYPVTLAQDGARHTISRLFLGARINGDVDGTPSSNATSDVNDDGVVALTSFLSTDVTTTASFSISATGPGKLDGWIDFNQDGVWSGPGEQIFVSQEVVAGENLLSFSVPPGITERSTGARFRLSSAGLLAPTGSASDGEVEDYVVAIVVGTPTASVDINVPSGASNVVIENDQLVVKQGETVLFQSPLTSFGDLSLAGSTLDDIFQLAIQSSLINGTLSFDGGLGKDVLNLISSGQTLDLTSASINLKDVEGIDLTGSGANKLVISIDAVKAASSTTDTLRLRSDSGDTIEFGTGWSVQNPAFVDGQFVHVLTESQNGGTARVELRNDRFFQNPLNRFDADRNGAIQPLDALRIINELSRRGTGFVRLPTNDSEISRIYFDVSGDNSLTALDALRIINALARINRGGEAEGEQAALSNSLGLVLNPKQVETTREIRSGVESFVPIKGRAVAVPSLVDAVHASEFSEWKPGLGMKAAESDVENELSLLSQQEGSRGSD